MLLPLAAAAFVGASVPVPTPAQLRYQRLEISGLIHFNMATYACAAGTGYAGCRECWLPSGSGNGSSSRDCSNTAGPGRDPATFNPVKLDTDNWAASLLALGAKAAVLTAKHDSGHLLWPTTVKLPDGSPYNYAVGHSRSSIQADVLRMFSDSMRKHDLGYGFYYSVGNNVYLNVRNGVVETGQNEPLPGMASVTQAEFETIAYAHLQELWTGYGNLTELWFDGGLMPQDMHPNVSSLLQRLQPDAAVYEGAMLTNNSIGWAGSESGHYPKMDGGSEAFWSTGGRMQCNKQHCVPTDPRKKAGSNGPGVPGTSVFVPKSCDTYLAKGGWFDNHGTSTPRPLSDLIGVYHQTVGRSESSCCRATPSPSADCVSCAGRAAAVVLISLNRAHLTLNLLVFADCVLELDFAINRDGIVEPSHASAYAALGSFVRECYGTPLAATNGTVDSMALVLPLSQPQTVDRVIIQEQLELGQRIRNFTVESQVSPGAAWEPWSSGESVGHKRILLLGENRTVTALRFVVTVRMVETLAPIVANFAAFGPCRAE